MTLFNRKTLSTALATLALATGGAALVSAPAQAGGFKVGFHGGHGHGGHWGHGPRWGGYGYGGYGVVLSAYDAGECYSVARKVFVPGLGVVIKRQQVCE